MTGLSDREVKNAMPTNIYKHIPNTGFLSMKFAKSLFPIATSSANEAATYTFVTPVVWANDVLGNVISINWRDQEPTKFRAAFEGASEAVVVTQSDEMLLARSRPNVSCAMRFSEPLLPWRQGNICVGSSKVFLRVIPRKLYFR
ncbi:hypothetical protein Aduo_005281 [Ancylostoma duodenale]